MKFVPIFFMFLFVNCFAVSIESLDEQLNNPSIIGLRTKIINDSNLTLRNVDLRLFFKKDPTKVIVVDSGYKAGAVVSFELLNDTLGYLQFLIDSLPSGIYPNTSGFYQGLHYSDRSPIDKSFFSSCTLKTFFVKNTEILLYVDGNLVYGDSLALPKSRANFKIVGFQSEGAAWIDVQNQGTVGSYLNGVSLIDADSVAYKLDSFFLEPMEILRICKSDVSCENLEKKVVIQDFAWGRIGEALLKKDSILISYVPWGDVGLFAKESVSSGVWKNAEDFFAPVSEEFYYPTTYRKNVFYRIRYGMLGTSSDQWFSYSDQDNSYGSGLPNPIKITMNKPEIYRMRENDPVEFSWLPVENISQYQITVRNANDQIILDQKVNETSVKMNLPDGAYSWGVRGLQYDEMNGVWYTDVNGPVEGNFALQLFSRDIDDSIWVELPIERIRGRKDSKLLNLGYGKEAVEYGWDRSHITTTIHDWFENNHCWLVSVQLLNHLYGGDITQDEIEFAVRFDQKEPLMSPFSASGGNLGDVETALEFALQTDDFFHFKGSPSYSFVKNEIDHNRPILVLTDRHAMIIYGYVGSSDNYAFLYAFYGDNEGVLSNSVWDSTPIEDYFSLHVEYGHVAMSDNRIILDFDGDGISDYDEIFRFGTDAHNSDHDGDGIDDKREIYNYTRKGAFSKKDIVISEREKSIKENIIKASDSDKDSIRAELDRDDNDDGIVDGLEGKGPALYMEVPLDYTLFARDHLIINDGVECFNAENENFGFCRVGSAGKNIFSYKASPAILSLGANAHVGRVDVHPKEYEQGRINMRSNSVIHNDLNLYVKTLQDSIKGNSISVSNYVFKQQGASVLGKTNVLFNEKVFNLESAWNGDYLCELPDLNSIVFGASKIVKTGERFVLKDGNTFNKIRVLSGGTLVIAPGQIYIDSLLQVESNAKIEFLFPGEATTIHINGMIIWRPTNIESLTNSVYWKNIARGFRLVQHSSKNMFIEGPFGGTIFAPLSKLILGQNTKVLYGRFFAKDITVHQYTQIYRVDFDPIVKKTYVLGR